MHTHVENTNEAKRQGDANSILRRNISDGPDRSLAASRELPASAAGCYLQQGLRCSNSKPTRSEDEEEISAWIYKLIRQCVDAIKSGDMEFAYNCYCKMVVEKKDSFLRDVVVPNICELK